MVERTSNQGVKPMHDETALAPAEFTANAVPKICLVDIGGDVQSVLTRKLYNCTTATLGGDVKSPKSKEGAQSFLRPLVQLPSNLHEFHVVVVDLAKTDAIDEIKARAELKDNSGKKAYALVSSYPEQVFNAKAFGSRRLRREMVEVLKKESVVVVFAAENENIHYDIAEISIRGAMISDEVDCDTLRLCDGIGAFNNKYGETIRLSKKETRFHAMLGKYLDGAHYEVTFAHPTVLINGKWEPDEQFFPFLTNAAEEIVGYATPVDKGLLIVVPQIIRKSDFLIELFDNLAEMLPEVFPYNGMFGWLEDGSYPLPGEQDLRKKRVDIEAKYVADVAENEAKIVNLKDEFNFLRVMLSGTGDELVSAVRDYLVWLGFTSAEAMDEHSDDVLEEDIQVQLDPGLLVVEVKGIGGTSKDKECAQISKIKNRRQEERRAWDVSALYVVNHQRYVSPKLRVNPPFTQNQIKDAKLDKRGLVTTYQLYNAYFDIVSGLVAKADVRKQLLDFGHVKICPPELVHIGVVQEIYKQGRIAILQLGSATVAVGTKLYVLKNDVYEIREIVGLQVNGVDVDEATDEEVGMQLDLPIKKGAYIYLSSRGAIGGPQ